MIEALLWTKAEDNRVRCVLCSHHCAIADGKRGICGVRENRGGALFSLNYGKLVAQNIDPVEKKPLFHFQPGSLSYSIASAGCNFRCLHCQNSDISQMPRDRKMILGSDVPAGDVVKEASGSGCLSISYTYTEPTIFFEYARDCALKAREAGLKNIFVTNGYMTKECLDETKGWLDAANVDVKSFSETFYKKVCGARLSPVLDSIEYMRKLGIWVEITTLVIPTLNDSEDELRGVARWIYKTDKSMPWHISAFYPAYKLTHLLPTPVAIIDRAREIGFEEGLRYVYTGNVPGDPGEATYCHNCKKVLIERHGFSVSANRVRDSKCPDCGAAIDGVWS
ncbi:MAG: AmmeMemoRadiSam system radical SAM enzyme [Deltaproteobacteria bacterium]|nr:AmmeMemoRadiSam system radical SAM enzyme [Deltaproteobacteria bacterium]